jgi:hypothetical protein
MAYGLALIAGMDWLWFIYDRLLYRRGIVFGSTCAPQAARGIEYLR